ncbi:MAG: AAA family ATPase [Pseudomonadota bacterium]
MNSTASNIYQYPTEVRHCMPLKLKMILNKHGITQIKLQKAIVQTGGSGIGKSLSQPAINRIINQGEFPINTPKKSIVKQVTQFLTGLGIPENELTYAFELDNEAQGSDVVKRVRNAKVFKLKQAPKHPLEFIPLETEMLSQVAKKKFKLFNDPFTNDVQSADDVFLDSNQRYIRESMYQTSKHGGFLAVVGESGSGKTTLRRDLIDRVQKEHEQIIIIQPKIIDKGRLTTGAICDAITSDLSLEHKFKQSLEAKGRQIEELLTGSSRAGNSHVLIIEEAHDLSIPTLKYLKRFWELEDGFKKLISILLIGQPELKNKLDERFNYEAREVIRRCEIAELKPLDNSLEKYLELKFSRFGRKLDDIFESNAFDAIRSRLKIVGRKDISMLYPLMVNNLVTKAMNTAAEIGATKIDADIIKSI